MGGSWDTGGTWGIDCRVEEVGGEEEKEEEEEEEEERRRRRRRRNLEEIKQPHLKGWGITENMHACA